MFTKWRLYINYSNNTSVKKGGTKYVLPDVRLLLMKKDSWADPEKHSGCSAFPSLMYCPMRIDSSEMKTSGEFIKAENNDEEPDGGYEQNSERGGFALSVAFSCSC